MPDLKEPDRFDSPFLIETGGTNEIRKYGPPHDRVQLRERIGQPDGCALALESRVLIVGFEIMKGIVDGLDKAASSELSPDLLPSLVLKARATVRACQLGQSRRDVVEAVQSHRLFEKVGFKDRLAGSTWNLLGIRFEVVIPPGRHLDHPTPVAQRLERKSQTLEPVFDSVTSHLHAGEAIESVQIELS